jgi:hypothetical protein
LPVEFGQRLRHNLKNRGWLWLNCERLVIVIDCIHLWNLGSASTVT